jgi:hypothetical protein
MAQFLQTFTFYGSDLKDINMLQIFESRILRLIYTPISKNGV